MTQQPVDFLTEAEDKFVAYQKVFSNLKKNPLANVERLKELIGDIGKTSQKFLEAKKKKVLSKAGFILLGHYIDLKAKILSCIYDAQYEADIV
jgi:uncharacterized protein YneF (UPF0154 family)